MTDVVTALSPASDSVVVAALERAPGIRVVRRCADVAELLAVTAAGVGRCVVVSADLRGLDLRGLERVKAAGCAVVGVHADEEQEVRLRQLGVTTTVRAGAPEAQVAAAVAEAASDGPPRIATTAAALAPPTAQGVAPGPSGEPPRGVVVASWGPLGAPGRTTILASLASVLGARGSRVLLVDADTHGACLAQVLGLLDEAPGVAAACRAADQGRLDLRELARHAPEVSPGVRVLTGLPRPDRWPEVGPESLGRVLEVARALADVVLVDCGSGLEDDEELSFDTAAPRRNGATLAALEHADVVLAVGAADAVSLQRFVRGLERLREVTTARVLHVVNRVRASSVGRRPEERVRETLRRFAGIDEVHLVPDDGAVADAALLLGRPAVEHAPASALARAVVDLAAAVAPQPEAPGPRRGSRTHRLRRAVRA